MLSGKSCQILGKLCEIQTISLIVTLHCWCCNLKCPESGVWTLCSFPVCPQICLGKDPYFDLLLCVY